MTREWIIAPPSPDRARAASRWGVPELVAQLLLNRGLCADSPATDHLNPALAALSPPEALPGATRAADVITQAVRNGAPIVIYGDYDVDGTTGAAILWHAIKAAGGNVDYYVPHRVEEGYGVNLEAVKRLVSDGAKLIVTVDCGITAHEAARWLAGAGVPFIVTDHHTVPAELPSATAIVHPAVAPDCPSLELCGAGVAFKLAWAIGQAVAGSDKCDAMFRELLVHLLPLAALGTIADIVPLTGENRVIARHGLIGLRNTPLRGLRALLEIAGLLGGQVDDYDVGFKLAPRINAAGRMGHARLAVELFTHADEQRASEIALYLEDHNRNRQATERRIAAQAIELIERGKLARDAARAIVVSSENWHAGVIGIVASRIVDRFHRPAVVISTSNGEGQGSARSIDGFDLHAGLEAVSQHLLAFGGHTMAAGLRIATDKIDEFTEAFVAVANNRINGASLRPRLRLDAEVLLSELTMDTAQVVAGLGPFGMANPRPRVASGWLDVAAEPRCVGRDKKHLQLSLRENGTVMRGIGFGLADVAEDIKHRRRCRVAFEPMINDFNGRRSVEMKIVDVQVPQ